MKGRHAQIGFSQRISLEWLERVASYALAGMSSSEVTESLEEVLKSKVSVGGTPERGNRQKAITILRKIWCSKNDECHQLRQRGLDLMRRTSKGNHIVCHWGMAIAVYPFVGVVAEVVGRLLQLQSTVVASQVQRRIREQYGERETVARAARRVLRCFIDWGVLQEAKQAGIYEANRCMRIGNYQLAAWLIEALVYAQPGERFTLGDALGSPSLFPFEIPSMSCATLLSHAPGLEAIHRGHDSDVIAVRR
jgi:hypothetical protein